MSTAIEALKEISTSSASLADLHPLKLDRWHKALLGVPDGIYMQYGCVALWDQLQTASAAVRAMVDLLGAEGLPVAPQELAQRTVRQFRWYVPCPGREAPVAFLTSWDKESSTWRLRSEDDPSTVRATSSLEAAFEKSAEWATEISEAPDSEE